jgi:hypothetical protein
VQESGLTLGARESSCAAGDEQGLRIRQAGNTVRMTGNDGGSAGTRPWKQPPVAKVYEAFSAVAAGRVQLTGPGRAIVRSSNDQRAYDVWWEDGGLTVFSTDNASKFQGYAGYPIIAVLLVLGVVHADTAVMTPLAHIDWHELNARFKRRYDEAVDHALSEAAAAGADAGAITAAAESVAAQLGRLELVRLTRSRS